MTPHQESTEEKVDKRVVVAVAVALGGLALALGFRSPSDVTQQNTRDIEKLDRRVDVHDLAIVEMKTQLTYIAQGVDELRGRRRREP